MTVLGQHRSPVRAVGISGNDCLVPNPGTADHRVRTAYHIWKRLTPCLSPRYVDESLHIPLEHGANDDWKTDNKGYKDIREAAVIGRRTYVAFNETGDYRVLDHPLR
jgi:hypothetical protein